MNRVYGVCVLKRSVKCFDVLTGLRKSYDLCGFLIEGNICESKEFYNSFKIEQTPFNTETLSYLNS